MQLNLKKALFLSSLLTVGLSCEAAPGELKATATPLPCNVIGSATECLIAYQQLELEAMADPGMLGASPKFSALSALIATNFPANCNRKPYKQCTPNPNSSPRCADTYYRGPCP